MFLGQRLIFVGCLMKMLDALGCGGGLMLMLCPNTADLMSKLGVVVMHLRNPVFLHLIPEHCHILYLTHPNDILLPLHFGHSTYDCAHLQDVSTVIALAFLPACNTFFHAT